MPARSRQRWIASSARGDRYGVADNYAALGTVDIDELLRAMTRACGH